MVEIVRHFDLHVLCFELLLLVLLIRLLLLSTERVTIIEEVRRVLVAVVTRALHILVAIRVVGLIVIALARVRLLLLRCVGILILLILCIRDFRFEDLVDDIDLFPRQLGWNILVVVVIQLRLALVLLKDFVNSQLDSSHFAICYCEFADLRVVIQNKFELIANYLLRRLTSEPTPLNENLETRVLRWPRWIRIIVELRQVGQMLPLIVEFGGTN